MKLLITKPKMSISNNYTIGSFHKHLFEYFMMNEGVYYGHIKSFSWNSCYNFWDITALETDFRTRNHPNEILLQIDFWREQGYKAECSESNHYYDYDSDKRYLSGVRYWLYPKDE